MAKDLSGDLMGKTVDDLVQLIKSGEIYVNVHTDANPKRRSGRQVGGSNITNPQSTAYGGE